MESLFESLLCAVFRSQSGPINWLVPSPCAGLQVVTQILSLTGLNPRWFYILLSGELDCRCTPLQHVLLNPIKILFYEKDWALGYNFVQF